MKKIIVGVCVLLLAAGGLSAGALPLGLSADTTFDDLLLGGYGLEYMEYGPPVGDFFLVEAPSGYEGSDLEKSGSTYALFLLDGAPWMFLGCAPLEGTPQADPGWMGAYLRAELGEPLPEKTTAAFFQKYGQEPDEAQLAALALSVLLGNDPEPLVRWLLGALVASAGVLESAAKVDLWIGEDIYAAQVGNVGVFFNHKAALALAETLLQKTFILLEDCKDLLIEAIPGIVESAL